MSSIAKEVVKMKTRQSVNEASSPKKNSHTSAIPMASKNTEKSSSVDSLKHLTETDPSVIPSSDSDSEKINFIFTEIHKLSELCVEIKELKRLNKLKDDRIYELEERVDALEQYSRQDNIVISGFIPKHRSYASAAQKDQTTENDEQAPELEKATLEEQVVDFLKCKNIPINSQDISTCHTLPSNNRSKPKPIVIRMMSRKSKIEVLRTAKQLKDTNIYINENLTARNAEIATYARNLRKRGKILSTWTRNCKIFIKANIKGEQKIMRVSKLEELRKLEHQNVSEVSDKPLLYRANTPW